MTTINYLGTKLLIIVPNAQFACKDNDYDSLIWNGPGNAPTLAEVEAITDLDAENFQKDEQADNINNQKALKAIVFATADRLGIARNVFGQEVRDIYRQLLNNG